MDEINNVVSNVELGLGFMAALALFALVWWLFLD